MSTMWIHRYRMDRLKGGTKVENIKYYKITELVWRTLRIKKLIDPESNLEYIVAIDIHTGEMFLLACVNPQIRKEK